MNKTEAAERARKTFATHRKQFETVFQQPLSEYWCVDDSIFPGFALDKFRRDFMPEADGVKDDAVRKQYGDAAAEMIYELAACF